MTLGGRDAPPPDGYTRFSVSGAEVVARDDCADAVRAALVQYPGATLHEWAARRPHARPLEGRGVAFAVTLPSEDATRVVVRHNQHGGLLAPVTGDRFLAPTRAPYELAAALRLAASGVRTPRVVAYAVYPTVLPLLARSDVATLEIERGRDLGSVLTTHAAGAPERAAAISATAELLAALARAGARHHDLNVKNVLLAPRRDGGLRAWALDVDRVTFHTPGDRAVHRGNLARLTRSALKWTRERGAGVTADELARLDTSA